MKQQKIIVSLAACGMLLGGTAAALACTIFPPSANAFIACQGGSGATFHQADALKGTNAIDANLIVGRLADSFGFDGNGKSIRDCVAIDTTADNVPSPAPAGKCQGVVTHDLRATQ
jgi:hypothetical protein